MKIEFIRGDLLILNREWTPSDANGSVCDTEIKADFLTADFTEPMIGAEAQRIGIVGIIVSGDVGRWDGGHSGQLRLAPGLNPSPPHPGILKARPSKLSPKPLESLPP